MAQEDLDVLGSPRPLILVAIFPSPITNHKNKLSMSPYITLTVLNRMSFT